MGKQSFVILELPEQTREKGDGKYVRFTAEAAIWVTSVYFAVRLVVLLLAAEKRWSMWLMLLVEGLFARMSLQDQLLSVESCKASSHPPKRLRLQGTKNLPRVDVLVTCCGEPLDIILDTVRAACSLDYASSCFRVLVLDDGASKELKTAIDELRIKWTHLYYHTRGRQSGQTFAKSGNLNNALSTLQDDFDPEFCAVVDADSILLPDFLRATLPHLLQDGRVALVSTRQYFYNLPAHDPLSQSRCHFYTRQNAQLDLLGQAIDAGSGAVFRRKAIVDAGGYPTFSFSEDWQLSLILRGLGHRIRQVQEVVQYGLVPTSLKGHVKQQNRWHIGHSQQLLALRAPANKSIPEHLQWKIALGGLGIMLGHVSCVIGFLAVPYLVASGNTIPSVSGVVGTVQFVLGALYVAAIWTYEWVQTVHAGIRFTPFSHLENSWLAADHIYAVLRFHLFSSKPKGSFVTGSTANSNQSSPKPASLLEKVYSDSWHNGLLFNVFVVTATLGMLFSVLCTAVYQKSIPLMAYPPLMHLCYLAVSNNWVPIAYLFNRPVYAERNEMLVRGDGGVAYPAL